MRFTNLTVATSLALASLLAVTGCEKSAEQQQKEALEQQQKANERTAEAYAKANEKAGEAHTTAAETAAKEQRKADEAANDLNHAVYKDVTEAREGLNKDIGSLDKKLADVRTKIANAKTTKSPKANLESRLKEVETKSADFKKRVTGMTNVAGEALKTTSDGLKNEIKAAEKQLSDLEDQIG